MPISAPSPLADHHKLDEFDCGDESLNNWLKRRARANDADGAAHVYVTCEDNRVTGYYSLSSYSITTSLVPGRFRRNMPDPIPVVLLGRLAVDKTAQNKRIGTGLIKDAAARVSQAAAVIGVRGIVVHAISERAKKFYLDSGFTACEQEPMTLVITLQDMREGLG